MGLYKLSGKQFSNLNLNTSSWERIKSWDYSYHCRRPTGTYSLVEYFWSIIYEYFYYETF